MTQPLPITGLHHVARATRCAEQSRQFYCEVLGFQELPRPPFSFRGAWLFNYGFQIHIIENSALPEGDSRINTRENHLAFRVDDISAVKERLADHGIAYHEQVNAGGIHQIFFKDPDGHQIEIALAGDPSVGYTG